VIPVGGPPPQPTDIHAAYHSWMIAGEPYRVSVAGPSNGFALLLLGDWMPTPITTPFGPLAVDPVWAWFVAVAFLPAPYGYVEWTFACPSTAPNAHAFAFQALTLSPTGQLGLSAPSPLTVGWRHGGIP